MQEVLILLGLYAEGSCIVINECRQECTGIVGVDRIDQLNDPEALSTTCSLQRQHFSVRMVGGGSGETERRKGKAPIELGDDSSTGAVITLSDSDSVGDAVQSKGDAKLKMVAKDLVSERQNQHVLDKELSRLLAIFPDACPLTASADLASQLKKTSPGKALERILHRYLEHGSPKAKEVPQQEPKPGMVNS